MSTRLLRVLFCVFLSLTSTVAFAQNNWQGGFGGNWSNGANWTGGVPVSTDDVIIYSGGYDLVYLDISSTINSLELGGFYNGTYSELTDNGVAQSLSITNALNIGQTGNLYLYGGTTVTAGADSTNYGAIQLYNGSSVSVTGNLNNNNYIYTGGGGSQVNATGTFTNNGGFYLTGSNDSANFGNVVNNNYLQVTGTLTAGTLANNSYLYIDPGGVVNLTSQPTGVTDVTVGSSYFVYGTFNAGANSAFNSLNSIEGQLYLVNGQATDITPGSGTLTVASYWSNFAIGNGSTVNINGNVNNYGSLTTGYYAGGTGNTLNISGTLTNNSSFFVNGAGDVANVGSLVNNGYLLVATGATLNVTTPIVVADIPYNTAYNIIGAFNAGAGSPFAGLTTIEGSLYLDNGLTTNISPNGGILTLAYGSAFTAGNSSTVDIAGDVNNSGFVSTSWQYSSSTGATITVSGNFLNNNSLNLLSAGDIMNVGSLTNNGFVYLVSGTTLNLLNQPGGITSIPYGAGFQIQGTVNDVTNSTSAFAGLTSIQGYLNLDNGQVTDITPAGALMTVGPSGNFDAGNNSVVNIAGDVNNSGLFSTSRTYYSSIGSTVNVTGNFVNNQYASLSVNDPGDVMNVKTLTNNGWVSVGSGATLNLLNQPGGFTDIPYNTGFQVQGSLNDIANSTSAFSNLTSIEGYLFLQNGQVTNITPFGGVLSMGPGSTFDAGNNSVVNIAGDVNNSGSFSTSRYYYSPTGSTVNVTGNFVNNQYSSLGIYDFGDVVNVKTLANNGWVTIGWGATLNLLNQPGGLTDIPYSSGFQVQGIINDVANNTSGFDGLTSIEGYLYLQNGQVTNITPSGGVLTLGPGSTFDAGNNSVVNITGDVNNSGSLSTSLTYYSSVGSSVNITGNLTNNPYSYLYVYDQGDVVNVGTLTNSGYVYIGSGATLNLLNQPGGITDITGGFQVHGNVNDVANNTNGFANLTSIEGYLYLQNGQVTNITPNGGILTISGSLDLSNNSSINVNGDLNNYGYVSTNRYNYSYLGSMLNVSGTFTNQQGANLDLNGYGDIANIATLVNNGTVRLGQLTTLNLTNQFNVTDVPAYSAYYIYGNFNNAGLNSPFSQLSSVEGTIVLANGQTVNITPIGGVLSINYCCGGFELENGSTVNVNGDLTNNFYLTTNYYSYGYGTVSNLAVTGTLTNNGNAYLYYGSNVTAGNVVNNGYMQQYDSAGSNTLTTATLTNNGYLYQSDYAGYMGTSNNITVTAGLINNGNIQQQGFYGKNVIQTPVLDNAGSITQSNSFYQYYGYADLILVGTGPPTAQGYDQLANGTLDELISFGSAGIINIQNGAPITLAGTLDLILQNGFIPTPGTSYTILQGTAGQLFGTFSLVLGDIFNGGTEKWLIDYDSNGFVQITAACIVGCPSGEFWYGGNGNWSNPGRWSNGNMPTINDDTTIYSGGNDLVNLDTPGSVKSLALGGTANGTQSELTDNGIAQTLTIANSLVVGQTGYLNLYGGTAVTAGADSSNQGSIILNNGSSLSVTGNLDNLGYLYASGGGLQVQVTGTFTNEAGSNLTLAGGNSANVGSLNDNGYVFLGPNALLNLTNQAGGITDVSPTAQFWIQGTVEDVVNNANGFANLQSVEGDIFFQNGQATTITPGNGTLGISITGQFDVSTVNGAGTTVNVNGNVDSAGYVTTSRWENFYGYFGGGNTLNVSGKYTNELNGGQLILNGNYYYPDVVNVGSLDNQGYVFVGPNSYLNLLNQPGGITTVPGSPSGVSQFWIQGTITDVTDGINGFANLQSVFGNLYFQNGQTTTITPPNGTLLIGNPGQFDVSTINGTGTTVNINGDMDSSSYVATSHWENFFGYYGGGNTLNVSGTYTNEVGGQLVLNGNYYYPDVVNLGSLVNKSYVYVGPNSSLNLVNQPGGITDVVGGSQFDLYGSFNASGNPALGGLSSVEGGVNLYGQSFTINPPGGILTNTGFLNIDFNPFNSIGSAITINGDVNNSGGFVTGNNYGAYGGSTVIINGNLTNNGYFAEADGQGENVKANTLANYGWFYICPNCAMTLTSQPNGVTDVVAGAGFYVSGSFMAGGSPGFANLNSVEGFLQLNDQSFSITPGSGTFTLAPNAYVNFDSLVGLGSNITIFGNVSSSGFFGLDDNIANGPSTLTVTGTVTVNPGGYFHPNDGQAWVASLVNYGSVYVGPGGSLTLTNQPGGITDVVQGSQFWISGTFNAGSNNAFAGLTSVEGNLVLSGQNTSTTPSGSTFSISNTGHADASYGSTFTINGNVTNSGLLSTSYWGGSGDRINITGTLSNNPGSTFNMYGYGDMASVGNLVNQGSINIATGATLDPLMVDNFAMINVNGTMVTGTGTPGAPGYYQFADGTLGEHIDVSQFGVIVVGSNGAVNLNGTLDIRLANGFNPSVGTSYDIITFTAGDLTGTFASILNPIFNNGTERWAVIYNSSGGYVELLAQNNSVPEPSSFLLLGTGLLGLSYAIRRRLSQ